mgnify:FL=1
MRKYLLSNVVLILIGLMLYSCDSSQSDKKPYGEGKIGVITARAMSHLGTNVPLKLIDDDVNTFWHSAEPAGNFGWVSISYPKPVKISKYSITRRTDIWSQSPVDFVLEGAIDREFQADQYSKNKWKIIDEQRAQDWSREAQKTYTIKQPKEFIHYRIRILATGDKAYASIAELGLIE